MCAHEHLLDAVQHQRSVRQPRERIVGGHERKLLLAARELSIRSQALALKALADANQRDIETELQHRECLLQCLGRCTQLPGAIAHHISDGVSPEQAASCDLLQRSLAMGRQLAEDVAGFPGRRVGHLQAVSCHPARHCGRGDRADALEAVLCQSVDHLA